MSSVRRNVQQRLPNCFKFRPVLTKNMGVLIRMKKKSEKERKEALIKEILDGLEKIDGIPSFTKLSKTINSSIADIEKYLRMDGHDNNRVMVAMVLKVLRMPEEDFLREFASHGKLPRRIQDAIDRRAMEIVMSRLIRYRGFPRITAMFKQGYFGISLDAFTRLIKQYPEFTEKLDSIVAEKVLLMPTEDFLRVRKREIKERYLPRSLEALHIKKLIIMVREMIREGETQPYRYMGTHSVMGRQLYRDIVNKWPGIHEMFEHIGHANELMRDYRTRFGFRVSVGDNSVTDSGFLRRSLGTDQLRTYYVYQHLKAIESLRRDLHPLLYLDVLVNLAQRQPRRDTLIAYNKLEELYYSGYQGYVQRVIDRRGGYSYREFYAALMLGLFTADIREYCYAKRKHSRRHMTGVPV